MIDLNLSKSSINVDKFIRIFELMITLISRENMKISVDENLGLCAHDVPLTPRGNAPLRHAYPRVPPQTPKQNAS